MDEVEKKYQVDTVEIQRLIRQREGRLQNWVGMQIGISEVMFSDMIRGKRPFPKEKAGKLAGLLGVSVDRIIELFSLEETVNASKS